MKRNKLKSHEKKKILLLGETFRENPNTILLSIPIFLFGVLYYSLVSDKQGLAGSYGHMGISFKNFYKHFWQRKFLLKVSYSLFKKSSDYAELGEGKVSSILHCGQVAVTLERYKLARKQFVKALLLAKELNRSDHAAYILGHMAKVEIETQDLGKAKEYLDRSLRILKRAVNKNPKSLYLQIWLSHSELMLGEYWLASGDRAKAKIWAEKARKRANKYNLKVRKLDVKKLVSKIGKATKVLVVAALSYIHA